MGKRVGVGERTGGTGALGHHGERHGPARLPSPVLTGSGSKGSPVSFRKSQPDWTGTPAMMGGL